MILIGFWPDGPPLPPRTLLLRETLLTENWQDGYSDVMPTLSDPVQQWTTDTLAAGWRLNIHSGDHRTIGIYCWVTMTFRSDADLLAFRLRWL